MTSEPVSLTEPDGKGGPAGLPRPIPFIKRVRLLNYKSIRSCDMGLDPMTVLVGPNGSGKSNFLDALAFLGEAVATSPEQALESRGGIRQVCSRVPEPTNRFAIYVEAQIPWGPLPGQMPTAHYGFEVAVNDAPGERPFVVEREFCRIPWTRPGSQESGEEGFEVHRGEVEQLRSPGFPAPRIQPDRLYLPTASARPSFAPLMRLSNMAFYNFELGSLRAIQPESMGERVGKHGEHLGDVLGALAKGHPEKKERVQEYLSTVTAGLTSFDRRYEGRYVTVEMRVGTGSRGAPVAFSAPEMSDGTLHAAGVIVALFQPSVLDGRIPLVGIEEPEATLHPAAAGVLFDAITEASGWVQVVATSHSADLLDRDDFPTDVIRAVVSDRGRTVIGPVDAAGRRTLRDKLFTPGELLRSDQLVPDESARDLAGIADFDVFES